MTDETTPTPEPPAETPVPTDSTAPEQAKAETPPVATKPQETPDWERAYKGLQTTVNKLHSRNEGLLQQNAAMASVVDNIKRDQREVLRATGGEDAVKQSQAREAQMLAKVAADRAAQAATTLLSAHADILVGALAAVGVPSNDPNIDWAADAPDVDTWKQRVTASVNARIQKAVEDRERKFTAKSAAEIKAEAEALAQRLAKGNGEDRIDTAKGTTSTTYVDRVKNLKFGTPEYDEWKRSVLSGRIQVK